MVILHEKCLCNGACDGIGRRDLAETCNDEGIPDEGQIAENEKIIYTYAV